jgi:glycosyltransferase involved in cell wall biosynthesis
MSDNKIKKVVHIFNELKFSGAEIMYAQAGNIFHKNGFELVAVSTAEKVGDFSETLSKNHYQIEHLPVPKLKFSNLLRFIKYYFNFYFYLKKEKISVLHIHKSRHYWFFALCAFFARIRCVRTVHNVFKNRKITWIKAYLERLTARKVLGLSFQSIGQSVCENELIYYKNPTTKINNWFDSSKVFPANSANEKLLLRKGLGISETDFVIITVGGCSKIKNHCDVIKAIHSLQGQINCTYLHLGCGEKEDEEKLLAKELGLSEQIKFVGNTQEVRKYLIASDVYIMPSSQEGLSIAAIEAMACGLPSILYNVPGLKDMIHNDDNGLLIPPNLDALCEAILTMKNNDELRNSHSIHAVKFVNQNFEIEKNVKKIIELYN